MRYMRSAQTHILSLTHPRTHTHTHTHTHRLAISWSQRLPFSQSGLNTAHLAHGIMPSPLLSLKRRGELKKKTIHIPASTLLSQRNGPHKSLCGGKDSALSGSVYWLENPWISEPTLVAEPGQNWEHPSALLVSSKTMVMQKEKCPICRSHKKVHVYSYCKAPEKKKASLKSCKSENNGKIIHFWVNSSFKSTAIHVQEWCRWLKGHDSHMHQTHHRSSVSKVNENSRTSKL